MSAPPPPLAVMTRGAASPIEHTARFHREKRPAAALARKRGATVAPEASAPDPARDAAIGSLKRLNGSSRQSLGVKGSCRERSARGGSVREGSGAPSLREESTKSLREQLNVIAAGKSQESLLTADLNTLMQGAPNPSRPLAPRPSPHTTSALCRRHAATSP